MTEILPWLPIILGSIIAVLDIRATLYFRRQYHLIGNNWIIRAFYRTSGTITIVVIILTLVRAVLIAFSVASPVGSGEPIRNITQFVAGVAVIWLAIIPILLQRYFEANEGRK